ncbi:MAG TPA: DUF1326 domain-containing protein, partial [Candidatus Thermoplasmatota archaeon]|nr:DUF1326 domain-containing protein [Candidatus Thermoplasmatota archaeon]
MAERWTIEGTCLDACDCTTLCPCNYGQDTTNDTCTPVIVYNIERGSYGATKLDGLTAIVFMRSAANNLFKGAGVAEAACVLDEKAKPDQRKALETILGGQAGGLFGMFGAMIKKNSGVVYAPIDYKNDQRAWSVKAGNYVEVRGGFAKAPEGFPIASEPKKAQTYDIFFGPTMEK